MKIGILKQVCIDRLDEWFVIEENKKKHTLNRERKDCADWRKCSTKSEVDGSRQMGRP